MQTSTYIMYDSIFLNILNKTKASPGASCGNPVLTFSFLPEYHLVSFLTKLKSLHILQLCFRDVSGQCVLCN